MRRVALFALLLSACADVCERGAALSSRFPERHAACFTAGTLPGPAFDAARCDDSMNACSTTDQAALHDYFDCVDRLPVCTQASRASFSEQFLACAAGVNGLSEGCFRP